jgi:hypothetical protein
MKKTVVQMGLRMDFSLGGCGAAPGPTTLTRSTNPSEGCAGLIPLLLDSGHQVRGQKKFLSCQTQKFQRTDTGGLNRSRFTNAKQSESRAKVLLRTGHRQLKKEHWRLAERLKWQGTGPASSKP